MSTFTKNPAGRTPFGKNVYLRSTKDVKTDSYTMCLEGVPDVMVDGTVQKVLQPGTVIAKITSGPHAGKVGAFQAAGTVEVQTLTGTTVTAGTYTITIGNDPKTTPALAYNATAATVQSALRAALASSSNPDDIRIADSVAVTGGPVSTTPLVITYTDSEGVNMPQATVDTTLLTGTIAPTTGTAGVAGAVDGRQTTSNIVGINDTFLPWQLTERDVEIAVVYEATVVQAWCFEYNAAGVAIPLSNTTRDAMIALAATKNISYK